MDNKQQVLNELDNLANIYGWHLPKCQGHLHQPDCPVVKLRNLLKEKII